MFIHACMMNDNIDFVCDVNGCDNTSRIKSVYLESMTCCKDEDIPTNISFALVKERNDISKYPTKLQINFIPPQGNCVYGVVLLANESVNEEQCMNYTFEKFNDAEIHTRISIGIGSIAQYQGSFNITLPYIFTACYSINFCFGNRKIIAHNAFLKTNYSRTEISDPKLECSYSIISDNTMNKLLNFEVNFSTPIVEDVLVELGLFDSYEDWESCTEKVPHITQMFHILEHNPKNKHPNFTTTLTVNGIYEVSGKFQSREITQNTNYCFNILYGDIRSKEGTLWKPPVEKPRWHQQCRNITNYGQFEFQFGIDSDIYSSLLLHIVTIILVAICGIVYIIYIIHTCKKYGSRYYTNIFYKWDVHDVTDNKNEMQYENTGIVLLYSKDCESFMSLMTDFREVLRKVCGCVVHDWYDGIECNYVAEIGGSEWFAEMLHKQYCIIWIDTPRMRSLITSRFKKNNSEQYNFIEICDFRDVVFPTIFNLAKRNVEESVIQEARHFIVRLKGFDNFEAETDPFVGLFSRTRYFIPDDLNSLCSDLPILKSDKVILSINQEQEHLEQYLRKIKSDLNK